MVEVAREEDQVKELVATRVEEEEDDMETGSKARLQERIQSDIMVNTCAVLIASLSPT